MEDSSEGGEGGVGVVSGADVVQLHGSVREVKCTHCGWIGKWKEEHTKAFEKGESLDCPACVGACTFFFFKLLSM